LYQEDTNGQQFVPSRSGSPGVKVCWRKSIHPRPTGSKGVFLQISYSFGEEEDFWAFFKIRLIVARWAK
jgi:hypothetical protein